MVRPFEVIDAPAEIEPQARANTGDERLDLSIRSEVDDGQEDAHRLGVEVIEIDLNLE